MSQTSSEDSLTSVSVDNDTEGQSRQSYNFDRFHADQAYPKGLSGDAISDEEEEIDDDFIYTPSDAVDDLGFGKFQFRLLLIAGACWMADAMEMMLLSFLSASVRCQWNLSSAAEAALTVCVFVGMMVGAIVFGRLADRKGRRRAFLIVTIITFVAGFASSFSPNIWMLYLSRTVVGVGVGGVHVAFTLFSEFLSAARRGQYLVYIELFWVLGSMGEALLALIVLPSYDGSTFMREGWRWLLVFTSFPCLVLILMWFWLPESPRFLMLQGRVDEAREQLRAAARLNGVQLSERKLRRLGLVGAPGAHIRDQRDSGVLTSATSAYGGKSKLSDLLSPSVRRTSLTLFAIWFLATFTYYGMVLMVTELFAEEKAGARCRSLHLNAAGHAAAMATGEVCSMQRKDYVDVFVTSAGELPGILITAILIDWIGRTKTMGIGFGVMGVFCAVLIACMPRFVESMLMFILRAGIGGAFQALYVISPESYPSNIRATGLGVCSAFSRIGGMVTPIVAQVLTKSSNAASIIIYSAAGLTSCYLSLTLVETLGKPMLDTLQENAVRMSQMAASGEMTVARRLRSLTSNNSRTAMLSVVQLEDDDEEDDEDGDAATAAGDV